ncbi:MAG: TonB-dependent receptor [Ignavibacteriales bacterium]|nr:TonB-dependent receptor [Ignavibacteriales bacterium]
MKRLLLQLTTIAVFLGLTSLYTLAQTGSIVGRVTDQKNGEGLPSANILVKGTYYGGATDVDGKFKIEKVKSGVYNIDVNLLGYKSVQYSGIKVEEGKTVELNVKMIESVLSLGQEVVIIGEKRLFDVEETSSKRTMKGEDLSVTAVQTVKDVVGLQTGVVQSDNEIHIRGSRGYENAYLVDGVSVQDVLGGTGFGLQISPDAIQEMEVITGGYNAEYGQATSGVVNITTKEGGDRYRGGISYKTDKINGTHSRHFSNTDILETYLSGPVPGVTSLLPGTTSFFLSASGNLTDGYTRWQEKISNGKPTGQYDAYVPSQLYSTIFGDSKYGLRLANAYSVATKVTWKPVPTEKLSYAFNGSVSIDQNTATIKTTLEREEPTPGYQYEFQHILDSANTFTQINLQHTLTWTHTLSPKSYYEIRFSRYTAHVRGDANGKFDTLYNEPRDIVTFPLQYYAKDSIGVGVIPGDGFYDVGNPSSWRDHYLETYMFKVDFTNNFSEKNKFKTGIEMNFQNLQMADISQPWIKPLGINNDIYSVSPAYGSMYAQDNITISGMILNFGLRFDYWFPGKYVDDAINDPTTQLASDDIRDQYKSQTNMLFGRHWKGSLSPRLGISHPVSDNQTLFFSYGHFSKLPKPTYVYSKLTGSSAKSSAQTIGNPNLNPETTVAYELGLRNQITENDVLTITTYYKDIFNYITARTARSTTGRYSTYTTYVNSDYARTRGLEVEYTHRFNSSLRSTFSGTYSIATGKSSSATEALYNLASSLAETAIKENYVSWDRPVQLSLTTNLTVKKNEPLFDFAPGVLDDYNVFFRAFYQSGRRYTEQFLNGYDPSTGRPDFISNSSNPYQVIGEYEFYINMNIEKYFELGFARLTVSLEIQNLLDNSNAQIINPVTGRAYEYGDATPNSYNDPKYPALQGTISPFPYSPARYAAPRTARLGIALRF